MIEGWCNGVVRTKKHEGRCTESCCSIECVEHQREVHQDYINHDVVRVTVSPELLKVTFDSDRVKDWVTRLLVNVLMYLSAFMPLSSFPVVFIRQSSEMLSSQNWGTTQLLLMWSTTNPTLSRSLLQTCLCWSFVRAVNASLHQESFGLDSCSSLKCHHSTHPIVAPRDWSIADIFFSSYVTLLSF